MQTMYRSLYTYSYLFAILLIILMPICRFLSLRHALPLPVDFWGLERLWHPLVRPYCLVQYKLSTAFLLQR